MKAKRLSSHCVYFPLSGYRRRQLRLNVLSFSLLSVSGKFDTMIDLRNYSEQAIAISVNIPIFFTLLCF